VEQNRLDLFTRFLDPAGVEPAGIRTAELTMMIMQLVASGRGVAALPNWAAHEYLEREYVAARPLGEKGLWCTLYAAMRTDQKDADFMLDFLATARDITFRNLNGIRAA
jgi:LysR family transcriptional regulator for metE and metH